MNEENPAPLPTGLLTRRRALAGFAATFVGLGATLGVRGQVSPASPREEGGTPVNGARTSLHYDTTFKVPPQRIYSMLLDPKLFAAFTGPPAEIDGTEGGRFSLFGGLIVGRNVELVPNQRIVQAWRPTHWNPGVYSIVKFELQGEGMQTTLVLDHTGFPEAESEHLDAGWKGHYLHPMAKFLT
jgi:activator of HSP90 ATPase